MKLGKAVVKGRVYLPDTLDTVKGQKYMLEDFGKGAFSFLIFEDMDDRQISAVTGEIKEVDHVASVLAYSDVTGGSVPAELLPDDVYHAFNADGDTLVAVFFDTSSSADETMDAIGKIRAIAGKNCLVSGISAMVTDLRDLCEREEAVYVAIAVVLAVAAMLLFLDNWLIPFVFLAGIGISILLNLGSNFFLGEISYITKALSAVLQLAVTMDYSIFLWHSYGEHKQHCADHEEAMALAIKETFASVIGSSVTTVAGFIALCFMTFTLGRDLGIVMAKGVLLGVLGCVTVLPAMILVLDKPLAKTMHRSLIPPAKKLASGIVKIFPVFLILFAALAAPAYYGYSRTNDEVYYDLSRSLPEDMPNVIANSKLEKEFDMGSTHMVLVNAKLPSGDVRRMQEEFKQTDGIKFCIGLESLVGSSVPEEMIPESVSGILKSDRWELMLLSSSYRTATGEMGRQVKALNQIIKKYDPDGLLVGEAACTNDLINITSVDFATGRKEPFAARHSGGGHRAGDLYQPRSAALFGRIAALYRADLHQHDPARRHGGLRDFDDDALQTGARARQRQKRSRQDRACRLAPVRHRQRHGTFCGDRRRGSLFRGGHDQLALRTHGARRAHQPVLRGGVPACHVHAV